MNALKEYEVSKSSVLETLLYFKTVVCNPLFSSLRLNYRSLEEYSTGVPSSWLVGAIGDPGDTDIDGSVPILSDSGSVSALSSAALVVDDHREFSYESMYDFDPFDDGNVSDMKDEDAIHSQSSTTSYYFEAEFTDHDFQDGTVEEDLDDQFDSCGRLMDSSNDERKSNGFEAGREHLNQYVYEDLRDLDLEFGSNRSVDGNVGSESGSDVNIEFDDSEWSGDDVLGRIGDVLGDGGDEVPVNGDDAAAIPALEVNSSTSLSTSYTNVTSSTGRDRYLIRSSNQFVSEHDHDFWYLSFPWLFPFARGGPDEEREKSVSLHQCIAHYLRLSHGRFLEPEFTLHAYDVVSKKIVFDSARIQMYTKKLVDTRSITDAQLVAAAVYREQCEDASRHGRPWPVAKDDVKSASAFFNSIERVHSFAPHTKSAVTKNRKRMLASTSLHSKGEVWLTVSPYDFSSANVYRYAHGGSVPADVPGKWVRRKVLVSHPGAGALAFEQSLESLIDVVIGWSRAKNGPYACGGLFGIARAWQLCVESQTRLSLHVHVLIWVVGHDTIPELLEGTRVKVESEDEFNASSIVSLYTTFLNELVTTKALYHQGM